MRARALRQSHSEAVPNETAESAVLEERAGTPIPDSAAGTPEAAHDADSDAERREWLVKLSHELRTPLNAIIGFTKLLHAGKAGPLSATQSEYVSDVLSSSNHLLKLINDALDFAKLEFASVSLELEPVDVAQSVREVCDALGHVAVAKRHRLVLDLDGGLGLLRLDARSFKQVLLRYLSNAIRFTPQDGTIRLRLRPDGAEYFTVEVEDSGPGIKPEDVGRLFVAFQKLDARKRHAGSGLGLALAKRLVEAQGGSVAVVSTLGKGSVFSARFPRRTPSASESRTAAAQPRRRS